MYHNLIHESVVKKVICCLTHHAYLSIVLRIVDNLKRLNYFSNMIKTYLIKFFKASQIHYVLPAETVIRA